MRTPCHSTTGTWTPSSTCSRRRLRSPIDTLRTCGELAAGDSHEEPRTCTTSDEAVFDFASSMLRTSQLRAAKTVMHGGGRLEEPRRYVVAPNGVTRISGDAVVPCHPMPYPYQVSYCHRPSDALALRVELTDVDGNKPDATAVAVCHTNTTTWDGRYFDMLNARRGEAICHYMLQNYVLWVADSI
ncbi:hypothetical protein ABZP36_033117 [Zizania latifolia]